MTIDSPLALYEHHVQSDWLDFNDHMNLAFYLLAFDKAVDQFYHYANIAEPYIEERGMTMFTLDANVTYKRELRGGDPIRVTMQILGVDRKKIHFVEHMYHGTEGYLAAATEWLVIHVDLTARRSVPFPDDIQAFLNEIAEAHAHLPVPPEVGRVISLIAGNPG
ncbi:MAG: thioesterase family protein [Alphaproteobacteria bacterium]|jgi:acyl-CoA thioester hydrolase